MYVFFIMLNKRELDKIGGGNIMSLRVFRGHIMYI